MILNVQKSGLEKNVGVCMRMPNIENKMNHLQFEIG